MLSVSLPVADPPNALKSFEQAHSVLDASSAKTPKMEREPDAPGRTNTVLSADRGLTRTIPPSPTRPTKSAPSELDVMLSGNALVPGTGIDSTFWVAASTVASGAGRPSMTCATESTRGTLNLNQNVRYEGARTLIRCHPYCIL